MEDYKPNSYKYKERQKAEEERTKQEKVITGTAKIKKKNELTKFKDVFISEDAANVKNYLLIDVLLPAIKNTIEDIVTNGIRMLLRGNTSTRNRDSLSSKVSYRNYYNENRLSNRYDNEPRTRGKFDYDDIVFSTRGDAEAVIDQMNDVIERYGFVTVSDYYDMADLTAPYTSNKYGWTNLRNAESYPVRDGYIIKFPKALPID